MYYFRFKPYIFNSIYILNHFCIKIKNHLYQTGGFKYGVKYNAFVYLLNFFANNTEM